MLRQDLIHYLSECLDINKYSDYAPNGLQIEGSLNVHVLATAVTASQVVIREAIKNKADALLVHHGYFWKGESPVLVGVKKERIQLILSHQLNLLAYHLPLDCHLTWGNNAEIARLLAIDHVTHHLQNGVSGLIWSGEYSIPMSVHAFSERLKNIFQQKPCHIPVSSKEIKQVAWCSGAAEDLIEVAAQLGVDAYISGEVSERTYHLAKELDIHYFACGHHATERYGVQALGNHLAERFKLRHFFIDEDNPI